MAELRLLQPCRQRSSARPVREGARPLTSDADAQPRFLAACHGRPTDAVPVWFMRQAGRSLPEYRTLKQGRTILELCRIPELAAEATLQPVTRLGVDAAILFSDIVVPLLGMGVEVSIEPGVGPVFAHPLRSNQDVGRLRALEPAQDVSFVLDAIGLLVPELEVPLIGFAGAPFTLACYLVEGGPSKDHARTKALMYSEPRTWNALMDRLTEATLAYLRAQVTAGADAVQLFDSWMGSLAPSDYDALVLPWVRRILEGLSDLGVPRILFGVATGELLGLMAASGADVVGVDWRVPLDVARHRVGPHLALQGNLDPAACLAPWETIQSKAYDVLGRGAGRSHIFNLGHGVLPQTDPGALARLVELVHSWTPRG
jgi:uroporphyrinogen decarboxylase